ncbi:hypothetical protein KFE94_12715 [bacterium SCSIO 12643]|nr:hypothetical protein KFE94_12715 [bacterium SCSIO 12643]
MKYFLLLTIPIFLLSSCGGFNQTQIIYHHSEYIAPSRNLNVCKTLKDSVIIYAIFVDVNAYHPWTQYDVDSTLDSLKKATTWIEQLAIKHNKNLIISPVIHSQQSKLSLSENKIKPYDLSLDLGLLHSSNHKKLRTVDAWANKIAIYASRGVKKTEERKMKTKNKVMNLERLIARLRNEYRTDNVAVMFFVNGYYENTPSASYHTYSNGPDVEYSIITNKNPAVIVHEFLHLFGAVDLYPTVTHNFNYEEIEESYPNEIMRIQHKSLDKLMISPITEYYIGWIDDLDHDNTRLLYHKYNVLEY